MSLARIPSAHLFPERKDGWSHRHLPPSVVLMDIAVLREVEPSVADGTLARARTAGLHLLLVDAGPPSDAGPDVARPSGSEWLGSEVLPSFVRRLCGEAGVATAAAVAISGQRPLLAAADGAGARGVMVPGRNTPPFHIRALPHVAPDLAEALDTVVAWSSTYAS